MHLFAARFQEQHGDVAAARASLELVTDTLAPGDIRVSAPPCCLCRFFTYALGLLLLLCVVLTVYIKSAVAAADRRTAGPDTSFWQDNGPCFSKLPISCPSHAAADLAT